jgi:iron complex transport system substrate-binding protein
MRIVSICPSNTEMIGTLGLQEKLVGVDNYSDWPHSVASLPRLGPDLDIDMDAVSRLQPDLVVASLSVPGMDKNVEALQARGLPHIVLNPNSLHDIANQLLTLAEACGILSHGERVRSEFLSCIDSFRTAAAKREDRAEVYWEWWPKPVFTPGGANWLTEISELAGGCNLFADHSEASVQTNWEEVLRRNPDVIAMVWVGVKESKMNPAVYRARPGWDRMKAVNTGRIFVLEERLFCRPSPRLLLGLQKLSRLLNPVSHSANLPELPPWLTGDY